MKTFIFLLTLHPKTYRYQCLFLSRNTSRLLLPRTCVSAEHSTYLTAFSLRATSSPLVKVTACWFLWASFSRVWLSSLKCTWVPTNRKGVPGQWCEISGTHCGKIKVRFDGLLLQQLTCSSVCARISLKLETKQNYLCDFVIKCTCAISMLPAVTLNFLQD